MWWSKVREAWGGEQGSRALQHADIHTRLSVLMSETWRGRFFAPQAFRFRQLPQPSPSSLLAPPADLSKYGTYVDESTDGAAVFKDPPLGQGALARLVPGSMVRHPDVAAAAIRRVAVRL